MDEAKGSTDAPHFDFYPQLPKWVRRYILQKISPYQVQKFLEVSTRERADAIVVLRERWKVDQISQESFSGALFFVHLSAGRLEALFRQENWQRFQVVASWNPHFGHLLACRGGPRKWKERAKYLQLALDMGGPLSKTSLHKGCWNPHQVAWLIHRGAKVDDLDPKGRTALHVAVKEQRAYESVKRLLHYGASTKIRDSRGFLAQHYAATRRSERVIRQLLAAGGVSCDALTTDGRSALHLASAAGKLNVVALLLRRSANTELQDGDGNTPQHLAIITQHSKIVAVLIPKSAGAMLMVNNKGRTPFQEASRRPSGAIQLFLLEEKMRLYN